MQLYDPVREFYLPGTGDGLPFFFFKEIIMSNQNQSQVSSSFFDLHVEGVGYLNRVRSVKPKNGPEFMACTVSALRGSAENVGYTKFDCKVSGTEAQKVVKLLEPDVKAQKAVIVGFKVGDIYPELFTFEKGERKGQQGVSIKGRLLKIKFAKVNGEALDLAQP
jgi:hypothetical protein